MARDITASWLVGLTSPGGLVLLAVWAFQLEEPARIAAAPYASYFCFGALAVAILLSWYYEYSRILFVAIAVGLTLWPWIQPAPAGDFAKFAGLFLLPLNFALFAWLPERGVLTHSGILKMGIILAQFLGVLMLSQHQGGAWERFLRWGGGQAGQGTAPEMTGWAWMPWAARLAFAGSAIFLVVLVFRRRTKVEQGLLWALAALFVALSQAERPDALFFYSAAAGLTLLLSVLEHGYDIAYRDALTGLPGRRAFNEALPQLGNQYTIAMCDVDRFKEFNDTHGHDAGDQVLRMVASKLSRVQGGGRVFRYGGEEFAVVFRGRAAREAQPFLESLREAIAATSFGLRGPDRPEKKPDQKPETDRKDSVAITISIGVAENSERHSTPELVMDAADAALYRAKESGRNCVKVAEGTPA